MKRLLSTLLVLTLLLAAGMVPAGAEGELLDGGVTNATGYPIVNEPIELEVAIWYASGVSYEYDDLAIVQKIAEDTGIQLKFRIYTEQEKVQLMYASADYPDISWRLDGSDTPKLDAIEAGDVVCLDDYMQYAPNIAALFEEYPNIKLQATNAADGRIYAFPFFEDWDSTFGLRDCTLINRVWLDELGLEIPTTLDELLEVLRAFKAAAGTGSISGKRDSLLYVLPFRHWQHIRFHLFLRGICIRFQLGSRDRPAVLLSGHQSGNHRAHPVPGADVRRRPGEPEYVHR